MASKNLYMVRIKAVREKKIPYGGGIMDEATKAYDIVKPLIGDSDKEVVLTMCVDTALRPVSIERTAIGTMDQCMVFPKEIMKTAILSNARGIVIFHNHPSGNTEPSSHDRELTEVLYAVCKLMGFELIDHIIVTEDEYYSFRENGGIK